MSAINAKDELLEFLQKNNLKLSSANLTDDDYCPENHYVLYPNYTQTELTAFLKSIDYFYDNGYGRQELYGTLWFSDGTWAERHEYDGSEYWEHRKRPDEPNRSNE